MVYDTNWIFDNIFDYWDQRKDAIFLHSRKLATFSDDKRLEALDLIQFSIRNQVQKFTDEQLVAHAFVMADDLYKAANRQINAFDKALFQYLEASVSTFCSLITKRGFTIHYLIDNTFQKTPQGMFKPLEIYE